jgi:transmembrane sensor
MPATNRISELLIKQLGEELSGTEAGELQEWILLSEENKNIAEEFTNEARLHVGIKEMYRVEASIWTNLQDTINQQATNTEPATIKRMPLWKKLTAAASIILVLGTAAYFIINNNTNQPEIAQTQPPARNDVNPGQFKARLTLADGTVVILDSAAVGELAKQGNTTVLNKEGKLVYQSAITSGEVLYNTVSTAKGETYSMTLADGSTVWLNSASSIHFPVAFPGRERRITITGEVYVQVAKNPAQPFIASAGNLQVLALGTEFNIKSYSDEETISTTLVEGSVKVSNDASESLLRPGQQANISANSVISIVHDADVEAIIAWKNGLFYFESADLKTILREFSRWYDIEVVYEGTLSDRKFFGMVKRSNTLKKVLEMLQDNNIEYRIEGRKLIVKSQS